MAGRSYRIFDINRLEEKGIADIRPLPFSIKILVEHLLHRASAPLGSHPAVIESLTDRELEVYTLVAQGLSNKEIAERLSLCLGTVKSHVSNILGKLQVNNRAQLALVAVGQFSQESTRPKYETSLN